MDVIGTPNGERREKEKKMGTTQARPHVESKDLIKQPEQRVLYYLLILVCQLLTKDSALGTIQVPVARYDLCCACISQSREVTVALDVTILTTT